MILKWVMVEEPLSSLDNCNGLESALVESQEEKKVTARTKEATNLIMFLMVRLSFNSSVNTICLKLKILPFSYGQVGKF